MSSRSRRLDRLYRDLTAKQRAVMVLRWWKKHHKPDAAIWSTMEGEDRREYGQKLDLIRSVIELSPYVLLLQEYVAGLEQTHVLLSTRWSAREDIRALEMYIRESTREPVTESEYRHRAQELSAALVPVHELVEIAIEEYARWTDADYTDNAGERVLSEEAQARACAEIRSELVQLFRAGTLTGEERETGVFISTGTFYNWLGEGVPILTESGDAYEVFPDSQAESVAERQRTRRLVDQLLTGARGDDLPLELDGSLPNAVDAETTCAALERLEVIGLRDGIRGRWCDLRGFEIVIAELAASEFNGEDPLRVETREVLAEVRRELLALREQVQLYAGDIKLTEPDPGAVKQLRKTVERRAKRR